MPRPPKERRVEFIPEVKYFKPAGVPVRDLEEVVLTIEEVEAIRLKDKEGLMQEECADRMQVSRATFQRVLMEARKKIADALIEGKAIRVQGGDYRLAVKKFRCRKCDKVFKYTLEEYRREEQKVCPECNSRLEIDHSHRHRHRFGKS
ncbi:hypothetical protein BBF96_07865 [Anoxybacter fermentans]|uniref:UPF0251 protein BBF96_07865 n=1 Tax=Anoxybacter fermentans TaxID=1323375 RepID=A0A3Q9HQE0_9FIRM|nr:DUF134 domain-containing protein [Anoxybacter fermentans]AZR73306.1 hypothetical protein BBF96_07865 [Anoxybacter fermentans]